MIRSDGCLLHFTKGQITNLMRIDAFMLFSGKTNTANSRMGRVEAHRGGVGAAEGGTNSPQTEAVRSEDSFVEGRWE